MLLTLFPSVQIPLFPSVADLLRPSVNLLPTPVPALKELDRSLCAAFRRNNFVALVLEPGHLALCIAPGLPLDFFFAAMRVDGAGEQ